MAERYGIDAPRVVVALGVSGLLCAVAAVLVGGVAGAVPAAFLGLWAVVLWLQTGWMVLGSLLGKRREWRRLLDGLALAGDERVLEVGPGTGPALVEVARRLPRGRAGGGGGAPPVAARPGGRRRPGAPRRPGRQLPRGPAGQRGRGRGGGAGRGARRGHAVAAVPRRHLRGGPGQPGGAQPAGGRPRRRGRGDVAGAGAGRAAGDP